MNNDYKISFRVTGDVKKLLDELVQIDFVEANKMNRIALNRSQIIVQAIKEYYAARVNGQTQNSYLDLIDARLIQILEGYFSAERSHISAVRQDINNNVQKVVLMLKLVLMGTELKRDEEMVRKQLNNEGAFEAIINQLLEGKSGR